MSKATKLFSLLLGKTAEKQDPGASNDPELVRRQQLRRIATAICLIIAAVAVASAAFKIFSAGKEAEKGSGKVRVSFLQDKMGSEIQKSADLGRLKYLEDENKALQDNVSKLTEQLNPKSSGISRDVERPGEFQPERKPSLFIPPEPPSGGPAPSIPQFDTEGDASKGNDRALPQLPFAPVQKMRNPAVIEHGAEAPHPNPVAAALKNTPSIRVFGEPSGTKGRDASKRKGDTGPKVWIPSGSFARGQLLSGLDAPTGGYSQSNPHPVLIRLTNLAILPGRQRMDIKECFVVGAGYGDMASERAYIRTESVSCVKKDRKTVDMPVKGYVVGEDGKVGMRGRLVSKQGQMLARALLAGFASGMSDAFKPITPTYYTSTDGGSDGRMVIPNAQNVLQAGAMGGMSKALDRLAHFYIDMAKQVFPIVEIDAGRHVEVVVLKGTEISDDKVAGN